LRTDSCGDGQSRGGVGLRREIRLLADAGQFSELSDRNIVPPYGVCGGYSAWPNRFHVIRDNAVIEPSPVPGKVSGFPIHKDDVVVLESAGGGGYGDPTQRSAQRVLRDAQLGYITIERAASRYGVVVRDDSIDEEATIAQRTALRARRIWFDVEGADYEPFEQGRRVCRLSVSDAARLGGHGVLAEIINPKGAPLRFWVIHDEQARPGAITLGPIARQILGAAAGKRVEVRPLSVAVA
jgi:N-methylhydantoinase B